MAKPAKPLEQEYLHKKMKYKVLFLTIIVLAMYSCQEKENTLAQENLKGNVSFYTIYRYKVEMNSGETDREKLIGQDNYCDMPLYTAGNRELWYYGNQIGVWSTEVVFNKSGFVEKATHYDEDIDMCGQTVFEWDQDRLIAVYSYRGRNNPEYIFERKYEDNVLMEETYVDQYKAEMKKYQTNSKGIIEQCIMYRKWSYGGMLDTVRVINTIENNRIVEAASYRVSASEPDVIEKYLYYENGKVKEQTSIRRDGGSVSTIKRNPKGLIESIVNDNATYPIYQMFTYNEHNDVIEYITGNEEFRFEYEYDRKGNWIKRTSYKGTMPLYIEERKVGYYSFFDTIF